MDDPSTNESPADPTPSGDSAIPTDRVTLSNGIVLRVKPVNSALQNRAITSIPMPAVPVVDGAHGTPEENPNDPDWLDACETVAGARLAKLSEVMFSIGTEVVDVPHGMWWPTDDEWIEELDAVGMKPRDYPPANLTTGSAKARIERYWDWLKFYAIPSIDDEALLSMAVFGRSMVVEGEVRHTIAMFRGRARGNPDPGVPPAVEPIDGDRVREEDPGDSPGIRAEDGGPSGGLQLEPIRSAAN